MSRLCIAMLIVLSWVVNAHGTTIHVKPTMTIIQPGQSAAVITLTNNGDQPINAQVRVFGWDQAQKDILAPTAKLVASPPMLTLAPGQVQSVRLVRTGKSPATAVEAYRLLVDEVPDASKPSDLGVVLQMRYSLPVFVLPRGNLKPANLAMTAAVEGDTLTLSARNQGEAYAQASGVSLAYAGKVVAPVLPGLLGYVLPGKSIEWKVPIPASVSAKGKPAGVTMMVNGRELQVSL